ncbi:STE3-like pheromone receptor [Flagelloscypha sp. PMI_526]|nr:STE3-like pheromone receptor [Flagelloscypha sp. PMI_526]
MFWKVVGSSITAVNAIVWRDDAIDHALVFVLMAFATPATRLQVSITVRIPAASLCINRHLYNIATSNSIGTSRKDKRDTLLVDAAIAFGIPILKMILPISEITVQGHHYDIFKGLECQSTVINTSFTYPLVFLWTTIIGIASVVYCILTFRAF